MENLCWIDIESHIDDENDQVTDVLNDEIYAIQKFSHRASKKLFRYVNISIQMSGLCMHNRVKKVNYPGCIG